MHSNHPTPTIHSQAGRRLGRRDRPSAHFDVIVVGARAAGAATAMLLARRGLSVLAVDRSAYGSDTLSTHSLARVGVLQLSRWGLLDRLREQGTPVARTVVFHYDEPIEVDVSGPGDVDGLYSPRRTVLDRLLVDEARASGAQVVHGVRVTDVTVDATSRVDGIEADIDGTRVAIGARWVVGADGVGSRIARRVGAPITRQEPAGASVMYGYWSGLPSDTMHNLYDQVGRAGGVIPTDDGQACVWTAMSRDEFAARTEPDVRSAYLASINTSPRLVELLRDARFDGGVRGFSGIPGFLRHPVGPGWALVGDAGYFKDPVSAHGITDAFVGAELLADSIARTWDGTADEETAMDDYVQRRNDLAAHLMPPVAELAALDLTPAECQGAFRRLGRALRYEWDVMTAREPVVL